MTVQEKNDLAYEVITRAQVQEDKDIVLSIAKAIKEDRFFSEIYYGKVVVFLTWNVDTIEGKKHIFFNNCWIDPLYRTRFTLSRLRKMFRYWFNDVHKFYWFNRKKQKLIYRS